MEVIIEVKTTLDGDVVLEHVIKIEDGSKEMMIATANTAINKCTEELRQKLDDAITKL